MVGVIGVDVAKELKMPVPVPSEDEDPVVDPNENSPLSINLP